MIRVSFLSLSSCRGRSALADRASPRRNLPPIDSYLTKLNGNLSAEVSTSPRRNLKLLVPQSSHNPTADSLPVDLSCCVSQYCLLSPSIPAPFSEKLSPPKTYLPAPFSSSAPYLPAVIPVCGSQDPLAQPPAPPPFSENHSPMSGVFPATSGLAWRRRLFATIPFCAPIALHLRDVTGLHTSLNPRPAASPSSAARAPPAAAGAPAS